ncbi:MAG TPA: thiamine pyrophosphate-binding protein [Burkholderiales bacterium]
MTGAEALLRALRAMGVERIYASPGSDWAPLWEALAKPYRDGEIPEYVSSRHEETAIGMATGYSKVTGKPAALALHTTVGALHATMGLRAALHERIPVVVLAGESASFAEDSAHRAGRQWLRLLSDVGGPARLVAPTVKWSAALGSPLLLPHTVQRACQLAVAAPRGPVFLSVPTEFLMAEATLEPPAPAALPAAPAANPDAVRQVARALAAASRPVIVAEALGRNPRAVDALVALAESLSAPVLDGWHADYVNFPRQHPLYAGVAVEPLNEVLQEADFVLLAECVAPWHPPSALRDTRVASLGEEPLHRHLPFWGFRADWLLQGDAEATLASLVAEVAKMMEPKSGERWRPRNERHRERLREQARKSGAGPAIGAAWVAHELNAVLPRDAIVVNETISHAADLLQLLDRLPPGGFYEATYGGLGMGLGTALGVKHAAPERPVIVTIGDGTFYYNAVPAAFGACQELGLPLLVLLFDNSGYASQKNDLLREYPGGWAVRTGKFAGTSIAPRPDYVMLARAFGGEGERVDRPADVRPALQRGLAAIAQGRLALVHFVLPPVNP